MVTTVKDVFEDKGGKVMLIDGEVKVLSWSERERCWLPANKMAAHPIMMRAIKELAR